MKYYLKTNEELEALLVQAQDYNDTVRVGLIMEILEYRKCYGPLGCKYLED